MAWRTGGTRAKHDSSLTAELMSVADAHPGTHTPQEHARLLPLHLICSSAYLGALARRVEFELQALTCPRPWDATHPGWLTP